MQVICEREQATVLFVRIEIDDAFLGGELSFGFARGGNKVPSLANAEIDLYGRPRVMRFDRVIDHSRAAICAASLSLSDDWTDFASPTGWLQCHEAHVVGRKPKSAKYPEFHWIKKLPLDLKTAWLGIFTPSTS